MKKTEIGIKTATLELTREELGFIAYLYNTSNKKLTKKEAAFFQEIESTIKRMQTLEKVKNSIIGLFQKAKTRKKEKR